MRVHTRFAPSPTGYLHLGSARTALYAWLYAKQQGGSFTLRIEDTDVERSTAEAVDVILDSLKWLGIDYNEGPFYQMQRLARYREAADKLLQEDKAYRCDCSKERLENLRKQQIEQKQKPRYDGHCRDLKLNHSEKPYVIRFRNPQNGVVIVNDEVRGQVAFNNQELDDLVLVRSDGIPTYNFSVVVDDWDMRITHVIRGDDHLNNTPRQMNILAALNAEIPVYAHLPMILNEHGQRFSKRHGAVSLLHYRDNGYLPEALLNYIVRLGWSYGDQEIFSVAEMIKLFNLKTLNKSPAAFNPEKLLWLNQHYLKHMPLESLLPHLTWQAHHRHLKLDKGPELLEVAQAQRERVKTLAEMIEKSQFFYCDEISKINDAVPQQLLPPLIDLCDKFKTLAAWTEENIHSAITQTADKHGLKLGQLAQPVRIILTGGTVSPPIDKTIRLLGKERTISRLNHLINEIPA
jgi:glutamyl-tRNA synthetase